MLEDVGSKMEFFWLSWAMLWHLGAKVGEQERKMRQLSEKVGFLVGEGGGWSHAAVSEGSRIPPP